MRLIYIRTVCLLALFSLMIPLGCSSKYPKLNTYWHGNTPVGEGNIAPFFWAVEQSGGTVTIKQACTNVVILKGEFTDSSRIRAAAPGQTEISSVITITDANHLTFSTATPSDQPPFIATAIQSIDCGTQAGANAIGGNIPLQELTAVPPPEDSVPSGANAISADCNPTGVKAQQAAGLTVPPGCLALSKSWGKFLKTGQEPNDSSTAGSGKNPSSGQSCDISGVSCTTLYNQDVKETLNFADMAALDLTGPIWPGNLIQGDSLIASSSGQAVSGLAPFPAARGPAHFTITGLQFANGVSTGIDVPANFTKSTVLDAINAKLNEGAIEGQAAQVSFSQKQVYGKEDLDTSLNVTATIDTVRLGAKLGLNTSTNTNYILINLTEGFYSVDMQPPENMVDVFADGANFSDNDLICKEDPDCRSPNVLLYMYSVLYGRQIYMLVSSSMNSLALQAALNAAYAGEPDKETGKADEFQLDFDLTYSKILEDSNISFVAYGGGIQNAISVLGGSSSADSSGVISGKIPSASTDSAASALYSNLVKFFGNVKAATYSKDNPGLPVSFSLAYLWNRAPASMATVYSYYAKNCSNIYSNAASYLAEFVNFNDQIVIYEGNSINWQASHLAQDSNHANFRYPFNLNGSNGKPDFKDHSFNYLLWNNNGWMSQFMTFNLYKGGKVVYSANFNRGSGSSIGLPSLGSVLTLNQGGCDQATQTVGTYSISVPYNLGDYTLNGSPVPVK